MGLYRYDVATGRTGEAIAPGGFDIMSATAGPGVIAYERLGSIWLYDLAKKTSARVPIEIESDFPEVRPAFKSLRPTGYALSPNGQRIAVTARGLVFTVPASKGDARLVRDGVGVERKDPAWSPDGKTLAYLTEERDVQELALYDLASGTERLVPVAESPTVYHDPVWSPDGRWIAYRDVRLNVWALEVATGHSAKIATGTYGMGFDPRPTWSPDSRWLAMSLDGVNHNGSIVLTEVATGRKATVTDGLADATSAVFDRDGRHLYFLASTDLGVGDGEDIVSVAKPTRESSVYAVVLKKGGPNPLQPESDEETPADAKKPEPTKPPLVTTIDPEGLEARTIALPIPAGVYRNLVPGPAGSLFVVGPAGTTKFAFTDRKPVPFAPGSSVVETTADGSKALLSGAGGLRIVATAAAPPPSGPTVDLSGLRAKIDPVVEWRRMFKAVWRNERALFYDPNLHGVDATAVERRYEPFLAGLASRDDLNYLLTDMMGELSVGHMWARGGDIPGGPPSMPGGLLGCDFEIVGGRYRLTRVYDGERWNPGLYAPLAQPGVEAKAGEYLLAIDGKPLDDALDLYLALEGKAGRQVRVKLGPMPDGVGSRETVVVPVASEANLRFRAWSEDNRRRVSEATGGRVGYATFPIRARAAGRSSTATTTRSPTSRDDRGRPLQPWRLRRRFPRARNDQDGVLRHAHPVRKGFDHPGDRRLRPQGDAHQRDGGFGRGHLPRRLPPSPGGQDRGQTDVGRPAHRRRVPTRGRRCGERARRRALRSRARHLAHRGLRYPAGYRGRDGPLPVAAGPGRPTRTGDRRDPQGSTERQARVAEASGVSDKTKIGGSPR